MEKVTVVDDLVKEDSTQNHSLITVIPVKRLHTRFGVTPFVSGVNNILLIDLCGNKMWISVSFTEIFFTDNSNVLFP